VFALPETFHGDHPPRELETGIFTGVGVVEIADDKISSGSFRSGRSLLLMFQHAKGRAGIREEYPVLPSGKTCRFYPPTRELTGPARKTREGRCILPQHQSGTPASPLPDGLL